MNSTSRRILSLLENMGWDDARDAVNELIQYTRQGMELDAALNRIAFEHNINKDYILWLYKNKMGKPFDPQEIRSLPQDRVPYFTSVL